MRVTDSNEEIRRKRLGNRLDRIDRDRGTGRPVLCTCAARTKQKQYKDGDCFAHETSGSFDTGESTKFTASVCRGDRRALPSARNTTKWNSHGDGAPIPQLILEGLTPTERPHRMWTTLVQGPAKTP